MSNISAVSSVNLSATMSKVGATDADGDKDGTAAGSAPAAKPAQAAPVVSKPTATIGNNVNTFA